MGSWGLYKRMGGRGAIPEFLKVWYIDLVGSTLLVVIFSVLTVISVS